MPGQRQQQCRPEVQPPVPAPSHLPTTEAESNALACQRVMDASIEYARDKASYLWAERQRAVAYLMGAARDLAKEDPWGSTPVQNWMVAVVESVISVSTDLLIGSLFSSLAMRSLSTAGKNVVKEISVHLANNLVAGKAKSAMDEHMSGPNPKPLHYAYFDGLHQELAQQKEVVLAFIRERFRPVGISHPSRPVEWLSAFGEECERAAPSAMASMSREASRGYLNALASADTKGANGAIDLSRCEKSSADWLRDQFTTGPHPAGHRHPRGVLHVRLSYEGDAAIEGAGTVRPKVTAGMNGIGDGETFLTALHEPPAGELVARNIGELGISIHIEGKVALPGLAGTFDIGIQPDGRVELLGTAGEGHRMLVQLTHQQPRFRGPFDVQGGSAIVAAYVKQTHLKDIAPWQ